MAGVDFNSDMAESFGLWERGADDAMMRVISSANVACGFHAGDPGVMRKTLATARQHGVAVGAHPGLPDLLSFGRRRMDVSPQDIRDYATAGAGVVAVHTAADFKSVLHGYLPVLPTLVPEKRSVPDQFALAEREVVYQGEPVAVVIADTRYQAADAAGAVEVDYELPAPPTSSE